MGVLLATLTCQSMKAKLEYRWKMHMKFCKAIRDCPFLSDNQMMMRGIGLYNA